MTLIRVSGQGRSASWAGALARTSLQLFTVLALTSFVVYAAMDLAPGSRESVLFGNKVPDADLRARLVERYGLEQGLLEGYVHWIGGVLKGDLGLSLATRTPVADRVVDASSTTVILVVLAGLLTAVGGIGAGIVAALRPGAPDTSIMAVTAIGIATPTFVTATVLIAVFGVTLGWFPTYGSGTGLLDRIHHLTLPAVSLAFVTAAFVARVTRSAVRTELKADHVETAHARGLTGWDMLRRHVIRNAMLPIGTVVGLQVAGLISGTIIVERAFGLNGLGQLLVTGVNQKDVPTVQAVCLIMVSAFVIVSTAVDASYRYLDPRVRTGGHQ